MRLLVEFAKNERAELRQNGIRVNVIGALEDLPTSTRHAVEELMEYTRDGERMTLTLALSYGGRQDIVEAARSLAVRAARPRAPGRNRRDLLSQADDHAHAPGRGSPDPHRRRDPRQRFPALRVRLRRARLPAIMWPDSGPKRSPPRSQIMAKKSGVSARRRSKCS